MYFQWWEEIEMEFRNFVFKNITRNKNAYLAYFLSTLIAATLLFSFTMLLLHPELDISFYKDFLRKGFYLSIVIAYVFITFFIFYSVSVFLKGRCTEFGILYILGISKKQVLKIISYENMLITSVSGILGVLLGLVFSKVFLGITGKILGIEVLSFYFPLKSIIITILLFIIIGLVISLFTIFTIKEHKVKELIKQNKKPKKEPRTNVFIGLFSFILLVVSYYFALTVTRANITDRIIPVTVSTIIATYLIFSHGSVYLLKFLKTRENFYRNNTKMLCISNLLFKIKDNTRMFFIISIISTFTFTSICSVTGYWINKEEEINKSFPAAFYFEHTPHMNSYESEDYYNEIVPYIEKRLSDKNIKYTKVKAHYVSLSPKDDPLMVSVISSDTFNELAKTLNISTIDIDSTEAFLLTKNPGLNRKNLKIGELNLSVSKTLENNVLPAIVGDTYVISNENYDKFKDNGNSFTSINVDNFKDTLDICKDVLEKYNSYDDSQMRLLLKAEILEGTKIGYGIIMFLCIFLGLVFFVTTSSFLYNKCYMDINDDKIKYEKLNKIGLTFKEIKIISFVEIGVLFSIPYIVAAIHTLFAINSLNSAFAMNINKISIIIIFVFFVVQLLYFMTIRLKYLNSIKKVIKS